jgi:hypothetical protein
VLSRPASIPRDGMDRVTLGTTYPHDVWQDRLECGLSG